MSNLREEIANYLYEHFEEHDDFDGDPIKVSWGAVSAYILSTPFLQRLIDEGVIGLDEETILTILVESSFHVMNNLDGKGKKPYKEKDKRKFIESDSWRDVHRDLAKAITSQSNKVIKVKEKIIGRSKK